MFAIKTVKRSLLFPTIAVHGTPLQGHRLHLLIWSSLMGTSKKLNVRKGEHYFERKSKGKRVYDILEPQPSQSDILQIHRYYTMLKADKSYKKRISWLGLEGVSDIAIVEYLGSFPGLVPHGNSKHKNEYVRTPAVVMDEMSQLLKCKKPGVVYNELTVKYDELSGPTGRKQVYDKKRYDNKKQNHQNRQNVADNVAALENMLTDEDSIVRSIIRDKGKAPCTILYNDEQITDLKKLCCSGLSILGIDKTFNLCDMHVTVTCFKHTSVVKESTKEHPIFLGPVFLHDNSDFESYSNFFNHLKIKLADEDTTKLVIGSDEEMALVNSVKSAFQQASHILCYRHLRQNTKQKLTDDAVDKKERTDILNKIFGEDGLIDADDSICFEEKSNELIKKCTDSFWKVY